MIKLTKFNYQKCNYYPNEVTIQ